MQSLRNLVDVIILAAGQSSRMKLNQSKMYLTINNYPVLYHTIKAFAGFEIIHHIFVVIRPEDLSIFQTMLQNFGSPEKLQFPIYGGKERSDSVIKGLEYLLQNNPQEIVMIHDGARPFVSERIVIDLYKAAKNNHAAIPVLPITDTVRRLHPDQSITIENRQELFITQTPQAFHSKYIEPCFLSQKELFFTDDAAYLENKGIPVQFITGEKTNIKITTQDDLN